MNSLGGHTWLTRRDLTRTRRGRNRRAAQTVYAAVTLVVVTVAVALSAARVALQRGMAAEAIAHGVTIEGVPVGGKTVREATAAIRPVVEGILADEIAFVHATGSWRMSRSHVGVSIDVRETVWQAMEIGHRGGLLAAWAERRRVAREGYDIPFVVSVDEEVLLAALADLRKKLERSAVPAKVRLERDTGAISVKRDVPGLQLDTEGTKRAVASSVRDLGTTEIPVVVNEIRARPTYDELKHINCVLGAYTTQYNQGDAKRSHNIALAASSLDGQLVGPGSSLSYNQVVGERTAARGYQLAHVYEEGEVRDGIGGGVCQVSSTLYNAALLAGLNVRERHPHMMPVAYVPTGRDATVDFGSKLDLVIANPLPRSVYLVTYAGGGSITCAFLGAEEDRPESVIIERTDATTTPYQTVETQDSTLKPGETVVDQKGRATHAATVYRVIKRPGQEPRRELLSRDRYPGRSEIVRIGTPTAETSPTVPPKAASPSAPPKAVSQPPAGSPSPPKAAPEPVETPDDIGPEPPDESA